MSAQSRNSPLAVTHFVGSGASSWPCSRGSRGPRVRGLTRGYMPASPSGIQTQKADAHPHLSLDLDDYRSGL
jgi:hypothetical protein